MNWKQLPQNEDLRVFLSVAKNLGFAAAAHDLGKSPAYVSKRIQVLEDCLGTKLFHRSTRSIALTDSGQSAEFWAARILGDIEDFVGEVTQAQLKPTGRLTVCSTFGFGRVHVGPALAALGVQYPELDIRLELYDRPIDIVAEGFDLEIRIGEDLPENHIAKLLMPNRRVLCAAPEYLNTHGTPKSLEDLSGHQCLAIKERGSSYGIWQLTDENGKQANIKVSSAFATNSGEVAVGWAIDSKGILLRSVWDIQPLLDTGELVQILPKHHQPANIWAVYPTRGTQSAKLRVCVEHLRQHFQKHVGTT